MAFRLDVGRGPARWTPTGRHRRRVHAARLALIGGGFIVLIMGAVLADAYYQAYRVYKDLKEPLANVAAVRTALADGTVPPAKAAARISQAADRAQGEIDRVRFTFRLAGAVPFLGRPVQAVRSGVAAAREGGQAATLVVDILRDVLGDAVPEATVSGSSKAGRPVVHNGVVNLHLIQRIEPRVQLVTRHLRAADGYIRAIPSIPFVSPLDRLKAKALEQSAEAIRLAEGATLGIRLLPSFLGADRSRTYLLAMQNNAELKATGGALLAYGFLEVTDGKLKLAGAGAVRDIDDPSGFTGVRLPSSLQWYIDRARAKYKGRPRLAITNMSPDFPAVAQGWSNLIWKAKGQRIDGVIALDPIAISYILGERKIRVPAYPGTITAANVVKVIDNDQYRLPGPQRLRFAGELIRAAWPTLRNPQPLLPTIHQIGVALSEKHLQIWSADQDDQDLLGKLRWDGALKVNPGDYLFAVNNQIRGTKLDYFVHTRIAYDVAIGPSGQSHSTCEVRLTNRTPPGQPPIVLGRKGSLLSKSAISLHVPRLATLQTQEPARGWPPHMEGDTLVFQRNIGSIPGLDGIARFVYSVPGVVRSTAAGKVYQLTVQHQPLVNPAELTIMVTLPQGTSVRSAPGWHVEGNVATFQAVLTRDVVLQIAF